MAQELRCKASGCQQRHARHYCKVCHDSDSNHRAGNCPSNSNRYQNNHNNDSNISVSKLLSEMQQLKKRLHDLETGKNEIPIDVNLGTFGYASHKEFNIPKDIPNKAKKILVYLTFNSGCVNGTSHPNITINVNAHYKVFKHHLNSMTYGQNAWAFNSDNMWLPMPKDRKITLTQSQAYSGNAGGSIKIIRYTL
eukprot:302873_1